MPTPTYTPLATITLTSAASSISFSSIPATYRDLIVVASNLNVVSGTSGLRIRFNSDTVSTYETVHMAGSGTAAASFTSGGGGFGQLQGASGIGISTNNITIVNIMDYSTTNKHKSWLTRTNQANDNVEASAGRWPSTAAINNCTIIAGPNAFAIGSTFSLYGVIA